MNIYLYKRYKNIYDKFKLLMTEYTDVIKKYNV
jgi:hypothetical protein